MSGGQVLEVGKPERGKEKKKLWLCSLCPETFRWHRHFEKHVEGHRNNACRLCDAAIATKKELSAHMLERHQIAVQDNKFQCEHCDRRFARQQALFNHYQSFHATGKVVCKHCGKFLDSERELTLHAETHESERPWKCKRCRKSFSRRQQFTHHMEAHERYGCPVCGRSLTTKLALAEHRRDEHGGRTAVHKCPRCGLLFERPCQLQRHLDSHPGDGAAAEGKEEGGDCCGRKFHTANGLERHRASIKHLEAVTPDDQKKYECATCGRRFARKSSVARHVLPPRTFACLTCAFSSQNAVSLRRHRALHATLERAFVCDRCGDGFFSLAALGDHATYRHSDERNFACALCSAAFKTNRALTRHLQAHSDTRPHACHCGQRCSNRVRNRALKPGPWRSLPNQSRDWEATRANWGKTSASVGLSTTQFPSESKTRCRDIRKRSTASWIRSPRRPDTAWVFPRKPWRRVTKSC